MALTVRLGPLAAMEPLGSKRSTYAYPIAGEPLYRHMLARAAQQARGRGLSILVDDPKLLERPEIMDDIAEYGEVRTRPGGAPDEYNIEPYFPAANGERLPLGYPWDLMAVVSDIVATMEPGIHPDAVIERDVELSGNVRIESGVRVLAGTRIKGNVYIGPNTFIGNSALMRGDVSLGPNSGLGFSADVKNALLLERSMVGPVAFVADTIAEEDCFFGGTARISNYRLDGTNVEVLVNGMRVNTGRRQFGAILGAGVKVGVGCVVLPGRKIGPDSLVGPNVVVARNIPSGKRVELDQQLRVVDV